VVKRAIAYDNLLIGSGQPAVGTMAAIGILHHMHALLADFEQALDAA
jgi:hypothetical protein